MGIKGTIGAALAGRHKAQSFFLKLATYPRFFEFEKRHASIDFIGGTGREKRNRLFEAVAAREGLTEIPITYYEFGVAGGASFAWWVEANKNAESVFRGFDSFEGLPEDWVGAGHGRGAFSRGGATPDLDDPRAAFVKGLFHETLPDNLGELQAARRRVIHMDADLYRSTIYPLMVIGPYLNAGDVVIFDEYSDSANEFRAFEDFCSIFGVKGRLIAATQEFAQAAFVLAPAD